MRLNNLGIITNKDVFLTAHLPFNPPSESQIIQIKNNSTYVINYKTFTNNKIQGIEYIHNSLQIDNNILHNFSHAKLLSLNQGRQKLGKTTRRTMHTRQ